MTVLERKDYGELDEPISIIATRREKKSVRSGNSERISKVLAQPVKVERIESIIP